jgi:hypothetical protein
VPSDANAIVMKSVIHDGNDERSVRILRNCHRALRPGARLVIDRIVPEKLEPTADHLATVLMDLNMLVGPGGYERTESEHGELLTSPNPMCGAYTRAASHPSIAVGWYRTARSRLEIAGGVCREENEGR